MESKNLRLIKHCEKNRKDKEAHINEEIYELLSGTMDMVKNDQIMCLSLVAVHKDHRVSNSLAGDKNLFKTGLNGGILNQLFLLNGG